MPTGKIKRIISDRGFGFIAGEDGQEYFFHRSGLDRNIVFDDLQRDTRVTFDIESSDRGPRATRVRIEA